MTPAPPHPLQLVCTDFDGTIHSDFELPAVPDSFQDLIARLQQQGVRWVINTGRELNDLLQAMKRARVRVQPDYLVVVEREIFVRNGRGYEPHATWNDRCTCTHQQLFARIEPEMSGLHAWVRANFTAEVFEDPSGAGAGPNWPWSAITSMRG
jgi:hypothetical protein